jgi:hypothetical protein
MAILRTQAVFPYFTGIPRDVWTNTMHWQWDEVGTLEAAGDELVVRIEAFYNGVFNDLSVKANYTTWTQAYLEIINLEDPSPRVPLRVDMPMESTSSASDIPTECSVVMTYASEDSGGIVRQRLYNRIYIGCLGNGCIDPSTASTFPQISTLFRSLIGNAANALLAENDAALSWIQYSPTSSTARPITRGWVDNSPDTQRRRSVDPTARTTWLGGV